MSLLIANTVFNAGGVPTQWLEKLALKQEVDELACELYFKRNKA